MQPAMAAIPGQPDRWLFQRRRPAARKLPAFKGVPHVRQSGCCAWVRSTFSCRIRLEKSVENGVSSFPNVWGGIFRMIGANVEQKKSIYCGFR